MTKAFPSRPGIRRRRPAVSRLQSSCRGRKVRGSRSARHIRRVRRIDRNGERSIGPAPADVRGIEELTSCRIEFGHESIAIPHWPEVHFTMNLILQRVRCNGKICGNRLAGDPYAAATIDRDGVRIVGTRATQIGRPNQRTQRRQLHRESVVAGSKAEFHSRPGRAGSRRKLRLIYPVCGPEPRASGSRKVHIPRRIHRHRFRKGSEQRAIDDVLTGRIDLVDGACCVISAD